MSSITRDAVNCARCDELSGCGDGYCVDGETPDSCTIDCASRCDQGGTRCQGLSLERCNLQGYWELTACPSGSACVLIDDGAMCTDDPTLIPDVGIDQTVECSQNVLVTCGTAPFPGTDGVVGLGNGRGHAPLRVITAESHVSTAHSGAVLIDAETIARVGPGGSTFVDIVSGLPAYPDGAPAPPNADTFCAAYEACYGLATQTCLERFSEWTAEDADPFYIGCLDEALDGCGGTGHCYLNGSATDTFLDLIGGRDEPGPPVTGQAYLSEHGAAAFISTNEAGQGVFGVWDIAAGDLELLDPPIAPLTQPKYIEVAQNGDVLLWPGESFFYVYRDASVEWDVVGPLPFTPFGATLSPNGAVLAVVARVRTDAEHDGLSFWDIDSSERILTIGYGGDNGFAFSASGRAEVAFDPRGDRIAAASIDGGTINVWNLRTGEPLGGSRGVGGSDTTGLRYTPDGQYLLHQARGRGPYWIDAETFEITDQINLSALDAAVIGNTLFGREAGAFDFSDDGRTMLLYTADDIELVFQEAQ